MNSLRFSIVFIMGSLLFKETKAGDTFSIINNRSQTVHLQFYRTETVPKWIETPYRVLKNGGKASVYLESVQPHTVFIHDSTGRVERLDNVDFHKMLLNSDDRTLKLIQLFIPETKTSAVGKTVYDTETRTRTSTRTSFEEEKRTRNVKYFDKQTGTIQETVETYSVLVPRTYQVEENYTIMVPRIVMEERTYSLTVVKTVFACEKDGVLIPVTPAETNLHSLDQTDLNRNLGNSNSQKRMLGVNLEKGEIGSTVKSVRVGSPATRLKLVGNEDGKRYTLVAGRHSIVKVNGNAASSVEDTVFQLQTSPPVSVLEVYDKQTNTIMVFEAQLELE